MSDNSHSGPQVVSIGELASFNAEEFNQLTGTIVVVRNDHRDEADRPVQCVYYWSLEKRTLTPLADADVVNKINRDLYPIT